jgi:ribosomal-protein-alanine N-acetyltransferase
LIETENLRLVPNTGLQLLALLERPETYEELSGFPAAPGLRDFFLGDEVSQWFLDTLRAQPGADPWRLGFAIVHPGARLVIGSCGFKGPPDAEGVVEIAYGIAPAFQGRGYATEAANALLAYAIECRVGHVIAHTLPTSNASTRVLTKCGFEFRGEVTDPEDGLVWRWERSV